MSTENRQKKKPFGPKRALAAAAVIAGSVAFLGLPSAQATDTLTDAMSRTVSGGWGSNWTYEAPASVDGSVASLTTKPGQTNTMNKEGLSGDSSASYQFGNEAKASTVYNRIQLRKDGQSYYSAVVRSEANKPSLLQLEKITGGTTKVLSSASLGSMNSSTGKWNLELKATGTDKVELSGRVWADGATAPAYQLVFNDTASTLTAGKQVGVSAYVSSGTAGAISTSVDNLTLTPIQVHSAAYLEGWGEPTFQDEFASGAIDTNKWRVRDNDYMDYDWAIIKKDNVTVKNGHLVLSTKRLDTPVIKSDKRVRDYSSAYVDTIGKFSQAYGRFEMRAKLPTTRDASKGIWPAFWLRPDDGGDGEIDIMEAYGTPTDKTTSYPATRTEATLHYNYRDGSARKLGSWIPAGIDVNDGKFHTWAVEWSPKKITFFVDGVSYFTTTPATDARWAPAFAKNRAYNIRLNVQVGSDYWGKANATDTADHTEYVIDYVRAWQK